MIQLKKLKTDKHRLKDLKTVIVRPLRLNIDSSAIRSIISLLLEHLKKPSRLIIVETFKKYLDWVEQGQSQYL